MVILLIGGRGKQTAAVGGAVTFGGCVMAIIRGRTSHFMRKISDGRGRYGSSRGAILATV